MTVAIVDQRNQELHLTLGFEHRLMCPVQIVEVANQRLDAAAHIEGLQHMTTNEVGEVAGVTSVEADPASKMVTVTWDTPANWEQIKSLLVEINYPPQELIQL